MVLIWPAVPVSTSTLSMAIMELMKLAAKVLKLVLALTNPEVDTSDCNSAPMSEVPNRMVPPHTSLVCDHKWVPKTGLTCFPDVFMSPDGEEGGGEGSWDIPPDGPTTYLTCFQDVFRMIVTSPGCFQDGCNVTRMFSGWLYIARATISSLLLSHSSPWLWARRVLRGMMVLDWNFKGTVVPPVLRSIIQLSFTLSARSISLNL